MGLLCVGLTLPRSVGPEVLEFWKLCSVRETRLSTDRATLTNSDSSNRCLIASHGTGAQVDIVGGGAIEQEREREGYQPRCVARSINSNAYRI